MAVAKTHGLILDEVVTGSTAGTLSDFLARYMAGKVDGVKGKPTPKEGGGFL